VFCGLAGACQPHCGESQYVSEMVVRIWCRYTLLLRAISPTYEPKQAPTLDYFSALMLGIPFRTDFHILRSILDHSRARRVRVRVRVSAMQILQLFTRQGK
jgi:hypothetical protein